ncbi:P-granule-associated novel protein 1-like [Patiria miniata]|uniref:Uncharacterized protein n=1 Tax=Patiria miniata TaxID=46514 RepID=A0A914AB46_PATMI|nr:P-granule-associated novel protein 1-like [Patiria miniata]
MRNCLKVHYADFRNNSLQVIETGTFKRCTNLLDLVLDENRISQVQPGGFVGLRNINNLNMTICDLKVLRPHTFGGMLRLNKLYLDQCHLEEIPSGLFLDPTTDGVPDKGITPFRL